MARIHNYPDPLDGLRSQLIELRGLVTLVPNLIEADRERRWQEIGQRPGDPDIEMIDIYESEAGADEGYGHADYGRAVRAAALITAWETYREFLGRELFDRFLRYNLSKYPFLAKLAEEEQRSWDRRFDLIVRRYSDVANVALKSLPGWRSVQHAHELRNAIVHNFGRYTRNYLGGPLARRPDVGEAYFIDVLDDEQLVDKEQIPLGEEFALGVINSLIESAVDVRRHLDHALAEHDAT